MDVLRHYGWMAYDEALADRIRTRVGDDPAVTEKRMFGGLAFLVGGHMAVAAGSEGALMVRCAAADTERLLTEPGAKPMVMRGRDLKGWLEIEAPVLQDETTLSDWVDLGVAYARTLPPKV